MQSIDQTLQDALQRHQAGKVQEASALYEQILQQNPNHPGATHLMGVAHSQMGRRDLAANFIERAISLNPNVPEFQSNLALVYLDQGQPQKALPYCDRAIQLKGDYPDPYSHKGTALRMLGRPDQAVPFYQRALQLRPDFIDALNHLSETFRQLNRTEDAAQIAQRAVQVAPNQVRACMNMGLALHALRRGEEASQWYRKVIALQPDNADAISNLGALLVDQDKIDEAVEALKKVENSGHPAILHNIGCAMIKGLRFEEAVTYFQKAVALQPDFVEALNSLGNSHYNLMQIDEAMKAYDTALYIRPDYTSAHWNRSLLYLLIGDFKNGWQEYEWRWLDHPDRRRGFNRPLWAGSDLKDKTLLLYAEQGFGDIVQFIRYVPMILERGVKRLIVECDPEVKRLLAGQPLLPEVYPQGHPLPEFDLQVPMMSLPYVFKTELENIPAKVPYIQADPQLVEQWGQKVRQQEAKLRVGIAWAGRPTHARDRQRSVSLAQLAPLGSADVVFYSLQKGPAAAEAKNPPAGMRVVDLSNEIQDFADSAAVVANMDMVIAVDTAVVHVAGALAKPVWVFTPFSPDWRWLTEREDSPWYPTMRLLRQGRDQKWEPVIARAAEMLKGVVAERP